MYIHIYQYAMYYNWNRVNMNKIFCSIYLEGQIVRVGKM